MLHQQDLFESEAARSLLDQLLDDSRLYHRSADYLKLLAFLVALRTLAPFNALLPLAYPVALRAGGAGL